MLWGFEYYIYYISRSELYYYYYGVIAGILDFQYNSFILEQIPRDILLEVLGPSKVYRQVIKSLINSTVAEYVQKVKFFPLVFYDHIH